MRSFFAGRFGGIAIFMVAYLLVSSLTRLVLLLGSWTETEHGVWSLAGMFAIGLAFDIVFAGLLTLPAWVYLAVLPERAFHSRWHRALSAVILASALYGILFIAVAEWFFWDEFGTRFNFIAVDYLVYTNEVVGNITESYPVPAILVAIAALALLIMLGVVRSGTLAKWFAARSSPFQRWRVALPALVLPVACVALVSNESLSDFSNRYNLELSRNGPFSFFAAYRNNELSYPDFYVTEDSAEAFDRTRKLVHTEQDAFAGRDTLSVRREVFAQGLPRRYNVIQITVESLSASFLGTFGNSQGLTPNLDRLAREGLLFTNFYATGTRTVRGMESLSLSLPPTPGQSIVRRPHNDHLTTLGEVMMQKGYRAQFIYGGYGYFDNMNDFFQGNGYEVIDRASVPASEISFSNVWGASDEDLYAWSMRAADEAFAKGQPFFQFVMTTSNHRPYTYPEGRIDIPSHTGRAGAVKYTDHAIGQFIEQARKKPWFENTIFVIVADHCAASAGKTDLPLENYRIPLIIYNPLLVPAGTVDTLSSQIDYAPTLLGLLNWSYESEFYGKNILAMQPQDQRALVSTYQTLGYFHGNTLTVLQPLRQVNAMDYSNPTRPQAKEPDREEVADAVALYQSAFEFYHRRMTL